MTYPVNHSLNRLTGRIELTAQLMHEYGASASDIEEVLATVARTLASAAESLQNLPVDPEQSSREPNDLPGILALRPGGPRKIWRSLDESTYRERLMGALLGRIAGCTLGAPVEGWPIERMQNLARENGQAYPPTDYWTHVPDPYALRYQLSPREAYTRDGLHGVPVDDDIAYTLLGLLVVEDYGPEFSIEDNGEAWLKYLPYACTAEDVALNNLKADVTATQAGAVDNPFCEWIGADIRSDPWAYMAPGWPEKAAQMAYNDAFLSHRRQGIYGEMYFSAVIAAAFTVDDPTEALEIGLSEIPAQCRLARELRWALDIAPQITGYRAARNAVDKRFEGMHRVHTINNACLTVWGITIGGTDFTKVIAETIAMGLDNDCTGATAGSIVGAVVGASGIPQHWTRGFENTVYSYLIDHPQFEISDLIDRFTRQARRVFES